MYILIKMRKITDICYIRTQIYLYSHSDYNILYICIKKIFIQLIYENQVHNKYK